MVKMGGQCHYEKNNKRKGENMDILLGIIATIGIVGVIVWGSYGRSWGEVFVKRLVIGGVILAIVGLAGGF